MSAPRLFTRFSPLTRSTAFRQSFQAQVSRNGARRAQSTAAPADTQNAAMKLWNSNVGPKTVHFWAPIMKWGLVLAGISDFARPAESLSLSQNAALVCTGAIWTRWCFVIRPKNLFLAAVNFFLCMVGAIQCGRIITYNASVKKESIGAAAVDALKEEGHVVEEMAKDVVSGHPEKAVKMS